MRLILASASPRRAELLSAAGYSFEVRVADVDERVRPGETPHEYVRRLAAEKSAAVLHALCAPADRLTASVRQFVDVVANESGIRGDTETADAGAGVLIVGADTTVVVDGEILAKPVDDADAERMLRLLSGRPHTVLTGVSVRSFLQELDAVDETLVFVRPLTESDIAWYLKSGEGRDKAGAYAIQGLASRFIPRIDGSYSNVVGLPVACVADLIGRLA